jgi:hypothetical protein
MLHPSPLQPEPRTAGQPRDMQATVPVGLSNRHPLQQRIAGLSPDESSQCYSAMLDMTPLTLFHVRFMV